METITPEQLLTVAGNIALVTLLIQFLVKPWLQRRHGLDLPGDPDPAVVALYKAQLNTIAAGLGVFFATLAQVLLHGADPVGILAAVLIGLVGGWGAIGLHQTLANVGNAVK